MQLAAFLASRLLRRRGTVLLRTSALAALVAVGLGVASLVVTLALMTGYETVLRQGILAGSGHVFAFYPGGMSRTQTDAAARLAALPGVVRAADVAYLPGLIFARHGSGAEIVTVRATSGPAAARPVASAAARGILAATLGQGLARRLAAAPGDVLMLQLVAAGSPRSLPVRVAHVFSTGFVELDERWATVDLAALAARMPDLRAGGVELWLEDPDQAGSLRDRVERVCAGCLVTTWQEMSPAIFAGLRWQKLSLMLVLSLVLAVGAFEIASALVVLVTEKRRELGVLLALGGQPALLRRTILFVGGALGAAGVAAGVVLGVAVIVVLNLLGLPHFSPEIARIYLVERIPLRLAGGDLGLVAALAVLEVVLAALLPARRVARRDPSEVLRWV
jgi:lipoprotein-releasing system permease protein